jgi:hypothetical protein
MSLDAIPCISRQPAALSMGEEEAEEDLLMKPVTIDPQQGAHAAAGMSNEELRTVCEVMFLELAVRTDPEEFEKCLRHAIARREECSDKVDEVRVERDRMQFTASVMLDIQRLPGVEEQAQPPTTGMYL